MGLPIIIVFICLWYLPLLLKHRKNLKEPIKYYVFAFLLGLVCFAIGILGQSGIGLIFLQIPMSNTALKITGFLRVLIAIAVVEELAKFLLGRIILKKVPDLTEIGSMLILGMTGIGFGFVESAVQLSIYSAVLRGVLMMHLFLQIYMGKYWWRAQEAKKSGDKAGYKKNISISLIVPILVHAIYDYLLLKGIDDVEETDGSSVVLIAGAFVLGLIYMIYTLNMARKMIKAETIAAAEAEAVAETEMTDIVETKEESVEVTEAELSNINEASEG